MKTIPFILITPLLFLGMNLTIASQSSNSQDTSNHIALGPNDLKWNKGPDSLPPGAQISILEGDPSNPGPFTMRLKFPAGYKIPPHWHPAIEHVTVLEGKFFMGEGDVIDEEKANEYPVGSFIAMPVKMHHFAVAKEESIIQLHGVGPWAIYYINAKDDPRKK